MGTPFKDDRFYAVRGDVLNCVKRTVARLSAHSGGPVLGGEVTDLASQLNATFDEDPVLIEKGALEDVQDRGER